MNDPTPLHQSQMQQITNELRQILESTIPQLVEIPESEISRRSAPGRWTKKEVLGHLTDSAHNNYRRFLCAQYEQPVPVIHYDQDFWVEANQYEKMSTAELILLWKLMNERIIAVLDHMPADNYTKVADTGKEEKELHSMSFLAGDYIRHMKHHLGQIFPAAV